jgi:hypothetical protein
MGPIIQVSISATGVHPVLMKNAVNNPQAMITPIIGIIIELNHPPNF